MDDRGTLVELFNPGWGWHDAPLVYCYCFTLRPDVIKGWAMHKKHEHRYFIFSGSWNWSFTMIATVPPLATWLPRFTCPIFADG